MDTTPIPAVVFTEDEIKNSNEINHIFSLPHEMKLEADYHKVKLFDTIKDPADRNDIFETEYRSNQSYNSYNTAAIYYTLNAIDLYRSSIYRFINLYFNKFFTTVLEVYKEPQEMFSLIKNIIIPTLATLDSTISGDPNSTSFKLAFLSLEQASDAVISMLTINYINFINDAIRKLCSQDSDYIVEEYKFIYNLVYKIFPEESTPKSTMIEFLTIILREAAESELSTIRNGLSMISSNTTFLLSKQSTTINIGMGATLGTPLISVDKFIENITDVEIIDKEDNINE